MVTEGHPDAKFKGYKILQEAESVYVFADWRLMITHLCVLQQIVHQVKLQFEEEYWH